MTVANMTVTNMTVTNVSENTAYSALHTAAVWMPPAAGVLRLTDVDRVDFLQRMTTNNIKALHPGESCVTVLTSPTARIIQVFTVLADEDALWLLPAPGETTALERHLRGQIFFMDKVRVSKPERDLTRLRVIGPQAGATLAQSGFVPLPAAEGHWQRVEEMMILRQELYDLPGYEVIAPVEGVETLLARLGAPLLDAASYTARRIELGRPAPGAELTGEYSPLEAGMAWACAENKGCYTGQEIIARQITYDKVTRTLVGLRSSTLLTPGDTVLVEGREVGVVTSAAYSPALQAPVALAILKRPYHAPGAAVTVAGVAAEVAALPLAA
ncbi:MAG TPA: aminomethyl transferase family protein [Chloroflexi bacterium]|nr:aminomethyl transferase family protein [Chloroflexota bacterium]